MCYICLMRGRIYTRVYVVIIMLCTILYGCTKQDRLNTPDFDLVESQLQEGDLLFRRGMGFVGRVVTAADDIGAYSHVGIAIKDGDEWCVIHAVPSEPDFKGDVDRVKCESLRKFWSEQRAGNGCLYRVMHSDTTRSIAVANARRIYKKHTLFDHDYDLDDTTLLYCTELIEYVYGLAGVSLSEGRRSDVNFPSMSGSYIMPSDLTKSELLKPIYSF